MPPTGTRRDPQPVARGGELALLALTGAGIVVAVAALVGLGVAAVVFGGGWVWPAGTDTAAAVAIGILTGHPGHGLPPDAAARVPGTVAVYGCVGLVEVLAAALVVAAVVLGSRWWRPNDPRRGMATRAQAADVLGVRRLKSARNVIRPDLYPATRREPTPPRPRRRRPPQRLGQRLLDGRPTRSDSDARPPVRARPEDQSW